MGALHIGFGNVEPAQQLSQPGQELSGLIGRAQIGTADHLDQRHATAVHIDEPHAALRVVFGLAGVFFHMHLVDVDATICAVRQRHVEPAAPADRLIVLGDLVALGQIGIEVVLAVEKAFRLNFSAMHRRRQQHGLFDHGPIEDGQRAWLAGAHRADIGVGQRPPAIGRAGAEDLALGVELDVDFETDDRFVRHSQW